MIILRQVNYSYPYLDQKEYNIISDIWYSGLKRAYKKNAGKIRKKINNKLFENMVNNESRTFYEGYKLGTNKNVVNLDKKQATELYKKAHNDLSASIRPLNTNFGNSGSGKAFEATIKTRDAQNEFLENEGIDPKNSKEFLRTKFRGLINKKHQSRRAANRIMSKEHPTDYFIFWSKKDGYESLGHEMGHVENAKSKNPIKRWINKVANNPETRKSYSQDFGKSNKGVKDFMKNWAMGKIIVQEEKNASKNSLKYLKENGATPEQLDTAKKNLKQALKTYKLRSKLYWMNPLYNATSIKGLRAKQIERDGSGLGKLITK